MFRRGGVQLQAQLTRGVYGQALARRAGLHPQPEAYVFAFNLKLIWKKDVSCFLFVLGQWPVVSYQLSARADVAGIAGSENAEFALDDFQRTTDN